MIFISITRSLILLCLLFAYGCGKTEDNSSKPQPQLIKSISKSGRTVIDTKDKTSKEGLVREAFKNGNEKEVLELINNIESLNFQYSDGDTPLSLASYFLMDKVVYAVLNSDFIVDSNSDIYEESPLKRLISAVDLKRSYEDRVIKFQTIFSALKSAGYKIDQNEKSSEFNPENKIHSIFFWTAFNSHYDLAIELLNSESFHLPNEELRSLWSRRLIDYTYLLEQSKFRNYVKYDLLDDFLIESSKLINPTAVYSEFRFKTETFSDHYSTCKKINMERDFIEKDSTTLKRAKKLFKQLDSIFL